MHSAEPIDPRSVNPANPPANASEPWRAELASRLNSYRARRKNKGGESLALDFDSTIEVPAGRQSDPAASGHNVQRAEAVRSQRAEASSAFDTNYYRRLNARAVEQPAAAPSATKGATAVAVEVVEPEPGSATAESRAVSAPQQSAAGFALDLPLHPEPSDAACLERYRIQGCEADDGWQEADRCAVAADAAIVSEPLQEMAQVAEPEPALQTNLIVFPRPLLEPPLAPLPSRDELAEPVNARPRILEVPEDIMPAVQGSLFPEIRLDGDEPEVCGEREPDLELPLCVAPVAVRLTAALADVMLVLAAGGIFAAMADCALPELPHTKPYWMAMGGVTVLFWALYQALFLLFAGRTIGMRMNGIHLSTFDGRAPEWEERRRRATFTIISLASVALGFLWALVDEHSLGWHDRASQTFPTTD